MNPDRFVRAFTAGLVVLALLAAFFYGLGGCTPRRALAAGLLSGVYTVHDTQTVWVYRVRCEDGTCNALGIIKTVKKAAGELDTVTFSETSGRRTNAVSYFVRENVYTHKVSLDVACIRVATQVPLDEGMLRDSMVIGEARTRVPGGGPLGRVLAFSVFPWDTVGANIGPFNDGQHAAWNRDREHLRRVIEVAGWLGWWLDGAYVN